MRLTIAFTLSLLGTPLLAQRPFNLDFEKRSHVDTERPWGWFSFPRGAPTPGTAALDSVTHYRGRYSLRFQQEASSTRPLVYGFGVPANALPLKGSRLTLAGWVRTDQRWIGRASLAILVSSDDGLIQTDSAVVTDAVRDGWRRLNVTIRIDTAATYVDFRIRLRGSGTAWFDAFELDIDNQRFDAPLPRFDPPSAAELDWLRRASSPFPPLEQAGAYQVTGLSQLLVGAQVIGLGEATHGTSEFQRVKRRLLEYAAENLGVTVLAIEEGQLRAERINRYVQGAPGDLRQLTTDFYNMWQTEEMFELVEWIRSYNASGRGHIEFVGFDLNAFTPPIDSIRAFLADLDPEYLHTAQPMLQAVRASAVREDLPRQPDSTRAAWQRHARELLDTIASRHTVYAARADTGRIAWAIQNANVLLQIVTWIDPRNLSTTAFRDSCMVANLLWHLSRRRPGTRVILTAHNDHVTRAYPDRMGALLTRQLGDRYRVIATTTYQGAYTADISTGRPIAIRNYVPITLEPAPVGSVEEALHRLGQPRLMLDLRVARGNTTIPLLTTVRPTRFSGITAVDWAFTDQSLTEAYDVLLFFDETHATRLLPCPPNMVCGG